MDNQEKLATRGRKTK